MFNGGFSYPDSLYTYQKEDVEKIVRGVEDNRLSWFLCLCMGMGKTIVALALMGVFRSADFQPTRYKKKKVAVVCPKSVVSTWVHAIEQWTDLSCHVVCPGDVRKGYELEDADVYIATYGGITSLYKYSCGDKQDVQFIEDEDGNIKERKYWNKKFECPFLDMNKVAVFFDEGHVMRNVDNLNNKAARKLRGFIRIMLTGTPVNNGPHEIPALCRVLNVAVDQKLWRRMKTRLNRSVVDSFVGRYMIFRDISELNLPPISRSSEYFDLTGFREIKGYNHRLDEAQEAARHVRRNDPASMRRLSKAVGRLLRGNFSPALIETRVSKDDRIRLAVEFPSDKMVFCANTMDGMLERHDKIIVVAAEVQMLWAQRLFYKKTRNLGSVMYIGSLSSRDRDAHLEIFKTNPACRILYLSLHAGGYGLNITEATGMVFLSQWYNVQAENQAVGRIHRVTTTKETEVVHAVCDGYEKKILELQESKSKCARAVSGDYAWIQGDGDTKMPRWKAEKMMLAGLEAKPLPDQTVRDRELTQRYSAMIAGMPQLPVVVDDEPEDDSDEEGDMDESI